MASDTTQHVVHIVKEDFGFGFILQVTTNWPWTFISYIKEDLRCKDLRRFDIIVGVNGESFLGKSRETVMYIIDNIRRGETASFLIERG